MKKIILIFAAVLLGAFSLSAQEKEKTAEQIKVEKELNEYIQKEVDRLEKSLDLDFHQVFYVDSILTHDFTALQQELAGLQSKKVSNNDLYNETQYKWQDQMYESMRKVLNDEQWKKYLKTGAASQKKARDKAREKKKKEKK